MANQIVVSAGAKVRNLSGVLTATSGVVSFLPIDVSLGIPQLDVNGKILVSQLPNSVMEYKGTWSAATNTPTLANGTGNQGDVYLCNVAGTVDFGAGPIAFFVGDQVIYSGSIWQRASGATGTVTSVAVTETGDSLNITGSPITTSGTINIGFNGTNLQYVNGAGNLTTFPILTGFVPYTGATNSVDLGAFLLTASGVDSVGYTARGSGTLSGYLILKQGTTFLGNVVGYNSINANSTKYTFISDVDGTNYKQASFELGSLTNNTARTYTLPNANGTIALTSDIPILTGYVPYTGATANVDLGIFDLTADVITGATGSFASNGGSDTFAINHSSGAGIALNITKGGNGEGLYINKTSGSGNAATIIGTLNATTLVKSGGTSSQFLKADGTVDSSTYALDSLVVHLAGTETITGAKTFSGYTTFTSTLDITSGLTFSNSGFTLVLQPPTLSVNRTVTLADITGTIAMLEGTQTFSGSKTFTNVIKGDSGVLIKNGVSPTTSGYTGIGAGTSGINVSLGAGGGGSLIFQSTSYSYTFPSATGTLALTSDISYPVTSVFGRTGAVVATSGDYTTTQVTEGTNLYFTDSRARLALSFVAGSGAYNSTTGVITIPTNNNQITNGAGYTTNVGTVTSVAALTIGTSGTDLSSTVATSTTTPVITLNVPTASAANRGALSSADWTTFNNKQNALTNPVLASGTWTSGYLPKINGTYTIGNSLVYDDGTNVGIGTATPAAKIESVSTTSGAGGWFMAGQFTAAQYPMIRLAATTPNKYSGLGNDGDGSLQFFVNGNNGAVGTTAAIINPSGNLGLGVTPSAWNVGKAFEVGYLGNALWGVSQTGLRLTQNIYYASGDKYASSNPASFYRQESGEHSWYNAPSGTAGNAITFTQAMTLTAAGNLGVGTASPGTKLQVNSIAGNYGITNTNGTVTIGTYIEASNTYASFGTSTNHPLGFFTNNNAPQLYLHVNGNFGIGTTTDATGKLQVNGTIYATGFYESSDIRFKNILETNPNINLSGIDVIKFIRKDNDTNQVRYGYSAQQVQSILPDAVTGTDFLNVNYLDVHTLKIAALEQEIKELKAKMN